MYVYIHSGPRTFSFHIRYTVLVTNYDDSLSNLILTQEEAETPKHTFYVKTLGF